MRETTGLRWSRPIVWLLPTLAFSAALVLGVTGGNRPVFLWLNQIGPATNDTLWANLTILGDTMVGLSLCLLLARRHRDLFWAAVIAIVFAVAWVYVFKPVLDIPRPPRVLGRAAVHVIGPVLVRFSFPSGHTTTAFTAAGLFVMGVERRAMRVAALTLAMFAGLSRIVVGVHWPMDVLAGAGGGWLSAALAIHVAQRTQLWRPVLEAITMVICCIAAGALVAGHDGGFPQAVWFARLIGATCLATFALTFRRPREHDNSTST